MLLKGRLYRKMKFKHFTKDEFACSHTGNNEIEDKFIEMLDILRENCGFPFVITSGYIDPSHPEEVAKDAFRLAAAKLPFATKFVKRTII